MEAISLEFYLDLKSLKEKGNRYWESTQLLIEYTRIITKIHLGQFDLSHMDWYGPSGIDKIRIDFQRFEDFRDFMNEKWIEKLDALSIPERDLILHYKKQEVPEQSGPLVF